MTWADFLTAVNEELGTDGTRRGIESQRVRWTRDAVVDLQRYIRAFRQGFKTRYDVADLVAKGYSHLGLLPAQAKPKAFYIISTGDIVEEGTTDNPNIVRNRLDQVAWENRQAMVDDEFGVRNYQYSVSPFSTQFLVHPLVNDETYLLIVWDGLKTAFENGDILPWPDWAYEAAAAYVKSKILLTFDRRIDLAREWYDPARKTGIYANLRLALYREQQESQTASGRDQEYVDETSLSPVPTVLANFGGQDIPFLRTITQLTGSTTASLAAIPTVGLTVPFTVEVVIGGMLQTWQLQSGTDATAPGIQRPNDYNGSTNAKIWVQVA